jgi:hypothetical protein
VKRHSALLELVHTDRKPFDDLHSSDAQAIRVADHVITPDDAPDDTNPVNDVHCCNHRFCECPEIFDPI